MVKCKTATQYNHRINIQLQDSTLELAHGAVIFKTPFKEYAYSPTTDILQVICNGHYETFKNGSEELERKLDFKGIEVVLDTTTRTLDMKSWATAG